MTFQRDNLARLASYLRAVDAANFDMSRYTVINGVAAQFYEDANVCGTVCCAAGHGPNAGVPPLEMETWNQYVKRCFITDDSEPYSSGMESAQYDWMFGADWGFYDNTPKGAAKRIEYFLTYGLDAWHGYVDSKAFRLYAIEEST